MKNYMIALLTLVVASFAAAPAAAQTETISASANQVKQAGNFGVGFGSGTTAAPLSFKYFTSRSTSIQANVGWWRGPTVCTDYYEEYYGNCAFYREALGVSADFLIEGGRLVGDDNLSLSWHVGAGPGIGIAPDVIGIAAAGVAGLQFNINALPLGISLEYRPNFSLVPGFGFDPVDFSGQIRYYF